MNIKNRIWILITKKLYGSTDKEEDRELKNFLSDNEYLQDTFDILSKTRVSNSLKDESVDRSAQKVWSSVSGKTLPSQKKKINIRIYIATAASVALLVCMGIGFSYFRNISPTLLVIENSVDTTREMTLSDGTKVWLSKGSKMSYPEKFVSSSRDILIEGEAFFDVARDDECPFIVRTGIADIKVLGTRFNVDTKGLNDLLYVVLESGSVSIENKIVNDNKPVFLKPNELAVISKADGKVELLQVDASLYTAWKEDKLIFKSQTLENIALVLSNCYKVKINIEDKKLKSEVFTGKFNKTQPLEQILEIIRTNTPFKYHYENEIYTIK